LRKGGCYFFSLFRLVEHTTGKPVGSDRIVPKYDECVHNGSMEPDCFVNDPVRVANTIAGAQIFSKIATHTNDPGAPATQPVFIKRVTNQNWGTHFLLGGLINWDSLGSNAHHYQNAGFREIV
jgi:hypothetical protein